MVLRLNALLHGHTDAVSWQPVCPGVIASRAAVGIGAVPVFPHNGYKAFARQGWFSAPEGESSAKNHSAAGLSEARQRCDFWNDSIRAGPDFWAGPNLC